MLGDAVCTQPLRKTMFLMLPFVWMVLWLAIAMLACAWLGLPPVTRMPETAAAIFACGGLLLRLEGWMVIRFARRRED